MSNEVEVVIKSTDKTGAGFKSAQTGAKDVGKAFDSAGEKADRAEQRAMGFRDTLTGIADTGKGFKQVMDGDIGAGLLTLGMGIGDLASGFANLLIPAIKGMVTGFRGAAAAVKAFTVSLLTNPIFLIAAAIAALVVGLVILYKKSETARNIMNEAFSFIGRTLIQMAKIGVQAFKFLVDAALTAAAGIVGAFAKIPGPQQKAMQAAAQAIKDFKTSADKSFDGAIGKLNQWDTTLKNMPKVARLQGDIRDLTEKLNSAKTQLKDPKLTATKRAQIEANISQLERQIASAKAQIASLKGKTVTITYKSNGIVRTQASNVIGSAGRSYTGGTIRGFAGGGNPPSGKSWVGERGPELLDLSGGVARITPSGNSMRQAAQAAGKTQVVLSFAPGKSRFEDLLIEFFRNYIRVNGGDVQEVLGR